MIFMAHHAVLPYEECLNGASPLHRAGKRCRCEASFVARPVPGWTASISKICTEASMAKNPTSDGKAGGNANSAFMKPLQPSKELAAIVGADPLPRSEVVSKVWEYIKANSLQNPENKREIIADKQLEAVFGKPKVTMFEMNKHLAQHLK
jgi:chromatin remodeling complex protein RSC6